MRTFATLLMLTTTALAQAPTEQQKHDALLEAYRLNGNSMKRDLSLGSIDLSHPHTPAPDKDVVCGWHEGERTGRMFYECMEYSRAVKTQRMPPLSRSDLDRDLVPPPIDCRKIHGVRKDDRCK